MIARPFTTLEHRWGQRIAVDIPVQVSTGLLEGIDGRLQNLSSSGGLLTTLYPLRAHSLVVIHFAGSYSGHAAIKAHVTRPSGSDAVGLEWCEFGSRVIKNLMQEAMAASEAQAVAAQKTGQLMYSIFEGDPDAAHTHRETDAARS